MDKQKVEFIESYIKIGNGDYQWNDNHGELIRCGNCKHQYFVCKSGDVICGHVRHESETHNADWFCADGEQKDGE